LKVRGDKQSVTNSGRLFHTCGPATAKARSPSDERRVAGTTRVQETCMNLHQIVDTGNLCKFLVHVSDSSVCVTAFNTRSYC